VNSYFCELIGYSSEEVIGRSCKFLQGEETSIEAIIKIRNAINENQPICQDLINYKKDGTKFGNRLVLIPYEERGEKYYLGMQIDILPDMVDKKIINFGPDEIRDKINNYLTILQLTHHLEETQKYEAKNLKIVKEISAEISKIRSLLLKLY